MFFKAKFVFDIFFWVYANSCELKVTEFLRLNDVYITNCIESDHMSTKNCLKLSKDLDIMLLYLQEKCNFDNHTC